MNTIPIGRDSPAKDGRFYIRFSRRWRALKGYGFGLREPIIAGTIKVDLPDRIDFQALDEFMEQSTGENLPEGNGGRTDGERLAIRTIFWSCAIQRHLRIPVFGRAFVQSGTPGSGRVETILAAAPTYHPQASLTALLWAERTINDLLDDRTGREQRAEKAETGRAGLVDSLKGFKPDGVNIFRMLAAAHELGIPARPLVGGVFCFGHGARSRWLQSSYTDRTPRLSAGIAGNKFLTAHLLRRVGLPAPTHSLVKSAEEAVTVARRYGYPVVVKPADRQQGRGVAANLNSDEEVLDAYKAALGFSKNILIERHFDGIDHRMTVLDGRLIRVSARLPGGAVGDGTHTVAELVAISKAEERSARRARERGRDLLDLDPEALGLLAQKGLGPDYVPKKGEYLRLRRRGNVSAGATTTQIALEDVHPDNRRLAERAVAAVRLDLAGVDIIFPDIGRSWMETGAHICEINGQPQIGSRSTPELLLSLVENRGRLPTVIAITEAATLDWDRLRTEFPLKRGLGLATAHGAWLDDEQLIFKPPSAFEAGQILIDNRRTEAALILMAPGEVRRVGLPVDRCDVLVIDGSDRWAVDGGFDEILTLAQLNAERTIAISTEILIEGGQRSDVATPKSDSLQQICREILFGLVEAPSASAAKSATGSGADPTLHR